jgi:hypothetical protein
MSESPGFARKQEDYTLQVVILRFHLFCDGCCEPLGVVDKPRHAVTLFFAFLIPGLVLVEGFVVGSPGEGRFCCYFVVGMDIFQDLVVFANTE